MFTSGFDMDLNTEDLHKEIARLKEEIEQLKKPAQANSYKLLLEYSPDIIVQVNRDYKVVIAHLPAYSVEQLDAFRGQDVFALTPPSVHHKIREALRKVFETGEVVVYESDGEIRGLHRHYINHVSAIKNEQGEITSAYFVCREATLQKLAAMQSIDSEQKLSALFEGSSQIISLFDRDSRFVWYNKAAYDKSIFLFGKFLCVGERFDSYLKEQYREGFNANFERVLKGEIVSYTREYTYQDKPFFLEIMLQPVYQKDELVGVSLIGNNHTERKEYEDQLEKANKELIQQNDQLNQYSYIISHNLRAPIVTLLGLITIFNQEKNNPAETEAIISHITKSANHLDTVIKDLNNVLTVTDRRSVMAEVYLDVEFDIVRFLLKNEIETAHAVIKSDFSQLPAIHSIKSYIHNILYNLLSNAIKYRKQNKAPVISVKSYKDASGMVCIEFTDDGIGVDLDKFRDKLFGFYKRFHSHVEGKGLGLHLIKKQIDALEGRIEVESIVGQGTTFKVLLPE
ncbi:aerobic respiration sensor-response protein; histidine protein kinase/phosphatase, sensor for arcA [Cytophaga hutchinsonii ATCC 33406]|uniref:histidine kinase n=2 Tax=Cytophaga hutchinsonii TaxID=985 RepID=A0A6N4SMK6_CYTH3|nr:aerobic respiration sensor-response protein; histidine protein kinase/phosphatase, sensor for arcA [Cytophaga hutchinsonii ATCC 33406]